MGGLVLTCLLLVLVALTVWTLLLAALWDLERQRRAAPDPVQSALTHHHSPLKG